MEKPTEFVDILADRRNRSDVLWTMRPFTPLAPHKLPPGTNYSRKQMIETVLAGPRITMLIEALAVARKVAPYDLKNEARAMLEEMVGDCHMPTIRVLGILVTKALKRILRTLHVNKSLVMELRERMGQDEVQYVYVPTHRSYLDFIIVSYILFTYDMAVPNIASGMDFYRMQVVGELLRKTGAFYMRRSFSTDQLYKEIFRAYIACIVGHSDRAIEFFIEGTRSRSQKSLTPKYGLLSMILEGLFKGKVPDIEFIPLSITYDRPLEEMLFVYELLGVPKPAESTTGLFKSLSILNDAQAYGNAYVNIAPRISARKFFNRTTLRESALSPISKLPSEIVKNLAYTIIDCQKQHTPLSPFNLIALLFNDRVYCHPREPYNLQTLLNDYAWLKHTFHRSTKALVNAGKFSSHSNSGTHDDKSIILESIFTHRELLGLKHSGELILLDRHKGARRSDPNKVKGHVLSERTMRIAVPAINMTLYINPCMAFLTIPALVASSILKHENTKESALKKYSTLRNLFINEFALDPAQSVADSEWHDGLSFLVAEDCVRLEGDLFAIGNNDRLLTLLQNLLLPFIAAAQVTCTVLLQWDVNTMGEPRESCILKEAQRQMETIIFQDGSLIKYPYALSLDLYTSTLASLTLMGVCTMSTRNTCYTPDRTRLNDLITELQSYMLLSPAGSYLDINLYLDSENSNHLQAKL